MADPGKWLSGDYQDRTFVRYFQSRHFVHKYKSNSLNNRIDTLIHHFESTFEHVYDLQIVYIHNDIQMYLHASGSKYGYDLQI